MALGGVFLLALLQSSAGLAGGSRVQPGLASLRLVPSSRGLKEKCSESGPSTRPATAIIAALVLSRVGTPGCWRWIHFTTAMLTRSPAALEFSAWCYRGNRSLTAFVVVLRRGARVRRVLGNRSFITLWGAKCPTICRTPHLRATELDAALFRSALPAARRFCRPFGAVPDLNLGPLFLSDTFRVLFDSCAAVTNQANPCGLVQGRCLPRTSSRGIGIGGGLLEFSSG